MVFLCVVPVPSLRRRLCVVLFTQLSLRLGGFARNFHSRNEQTVYAVCFRRWLLQTVVTVQRLHSSTFPADGIHNLNEQTAFTAGMSRRFLQTDVTVQQFDDSTVTSPPVGELGHSSRFNDHTITKFNSTAPRLASPAFHRPVLSLQSTLRQPIACLAPEPFLRLVSPTLG